MGITKRYYNQQFKVEAVKMVIEGGRKVKEVAANLGIHADMLSKWKQRYLNDGNESFPGKGRLNSKDEEFQRLQKELTDVKMERDILKKAVAIFSRQPK